ncbi:MAG: hypothetical protein U0V75_16070 [Ferruginibacter sp.]
MKKIYCLLACMIAAMITSAQIQQPLPLPKQTIAKPVANVKPIELANVIAGRWKGTRLIQNNGSVTVDSLWMEFKTDGTLNFRHQQYELNGPKTGTYALLKNVLEIKISKQPFSHVFNGTWNNNNGIISGSCTTTRAKDPSQPPYYMEGTETGSFTLVKY